jgi:predicted transcriptional regulator
MAADRQWNRQYSPILDNRIVTRLRCGLAPEPSLESPRSATHTSHVSTKQIVQDLLQKLPEDVSLHDVAQEIEFVAAVRQGLAEIDRGERIPIEEIERELPSWVIR